MCSTIACSIYYQANIGGAIAPPAPMVPTPMKWSSKTVVPGEGALVMCLVCICGCLAGLSQLKGSLVQAHRHGGVQMDPPSLGNLEIW